MVEASVNRQLLTREAIADYWADVSGTLDRLMAWMDSRESWVVEPDDEFIDLVARVIERVSDPAFAKGLDDGESTARLAEVFATLCSSRFLRVLEMFDKRSPGIVSRLTLLLGRIGGESEVFASLFYERLMVIHRCELLGQVFSPKRALGIADSIKVIRGSV